MYWETEKDNKMNNNFAVTEKSLQFDSEIWQWIIYIVISKSYTHFTPLNKITCRTVGQATPTNSRIMQTSLPTAISPQQARKHNFNE